MRSSCNRSWLLGDMRLTADIESRCPSWFDDRKVLYRQSYWSVVSCIQGFPWHGSGVFHNLAGYNDTNVVCQLMVLSKYRGRKNTPSFIVFALSVIHDISTLSRIIQKMNCAGSFPPLCDNGERFLPHGLMCSSGHELGLFGLLSVFHNCELIRPLTLQAAHMLP